MKENNQHCKELIESISDYVDGDLDPELCLELEKHLHECENCRVVVNTLKKTIDIYRDTRNSEKLPQSSKDRLYARLKLNNYLK